LKALFYFWIVCFLAVCPSYGQVEPHAGKWRTWVIASGSAIALPPPPNAKAMKAELTTLLDLQARRNEAAIKQINYWNAGAPGYRWNQIGKSLGNAKVPPIRVLALLNVAIYDATVSAWHHKASMPIAATGGRPVSQRCAGRL
jgi:hypothetical protein